MFSWFKQKPLEQKVQIIKDYAKKNELSGKYANFIYFDVAYHVYGWEDAASYFMSEHIRSGVRELA